MKQETRKDDWKERCRLVMEPSGSSWQEEEERKRMELLEERNRQADAYRRLLWLREHSMEAFLDKPVDFIFDTEGRISSQQLYGLYRGWCDERKIIAYTPRSFSLFLKKHAAKYNILYSTHIPGPRGGHVRGFRGIRAVEDGSQHHTVHGYCG